MFRRLTRRPRPALIAAAIGVAAAVGVGSVLRPSARHESAAIVAARSTALPALDDAVPATPPQPAPGIASTVDVIVGRNDTLDAIFRRMAFDKADLAAIRNLPGVRQSLDSLRPGDAIKITHNAAEIEALSRKVSETQILEVARRDAGFAATWLSTPVETRPRVAAAVIDSSLFQAAEASHMSDTVALKLANVFAWDIDFVLDLRAGDRFTVEYQQIYQNGDYVRDGEVLAAEFINDGKTYRAVRFTADTGRVGYYTPDGKPMRKAFLRAPVDFTRVSSAFAANRLHPILNRIRGHMGTDYAAPSGTPVHAVGDGRITFAGTRGGYGNAVTLLHSNGVSTLYGHLSRFARNLRTGSHVSQGEIIGYVGMTGLATGPHLHYEYLLNGVHMNPQTVRLPGAEPLHADALRRFQIVAAPLLGDLTAKEPPHSAATAALTASGAPGKVMVN